MKCLDSERLISYAYRLSDEPAAGQVRAHLGECPRCRETAEQHRRLGTVLEEWREAGPSPGFDARVGRAIEAPRAWAAERGFWFREWARSLAFASLGVLIIAAVVLLTQGQRRVPVSSVVATQQSHTVAGAPTPAQVTRLRSSAVVTGAGQGLRESGKITESARSSLIEDNDTQALENHDLAANFDLLSELPKGQKRIAN